MSAVSQMLLGASGLGLPVNLTLPVISGASVQVGVTLTTSTGTWSNYPDSYAYQWRRDGVAISGATSSSYTVVSADVGKQISVAVTATNVIGSATAVSLPAGTAIDQPPVNTVAPTISGTQQQNATLTATTGSWTNNPTSYAYQWFRITISGGNPVGTAAIAGATSSTYTITASDVDNRVFVTVTASNSGGSASASSNSTGNIIIAAPVNTVLPVISGTVAQGQTLSTTNGTWLYNPVSFAYQWTRDGSSISGATSSTYVLTSDDVGRTIRVVVSAVNAGGTGTATSNPAGTVVPAAPVNTVLPTITGTAREGLTLSASTGTWSNNPTSYAYQWYRGDSVISGATASTYTAVTADVGSTLKVTVTATNTGGSGTATSSPTSAVTAAAPVNTVLPVISGQPYVGSTLSTTDGTWTSATTLSYTYQWRRNGSAISGATASTYTLVAADFNNAITVTVTATNSGGSTAATSAATSLITYLVPSSTAAPTLSRNRSGTIVTSFSDVLVGDILITTNGTWNNAPSSYAYQWQRNVSGTWTNISGATSSSYTVTTSDPGYALRSVVTATNPAGSASANSSQSPIVSDVTGQVSYTTPGTYTWVCPAGVNRVSVVAVGGGGGGGRPFTNESGATATRGGGGGGLGYKNNIAVTPGQSYTVVVGAGGAYINEILGDSALVGANSYFINATTVRGGGAGAGVFGSRFDIGGNYTGDGGGSGGSGSGVTLQSNVYPPGGAGAGGYVGAGGAGGGDWTSSPTGLGGQGSLDGGSGGAVGWSPAISGYLGVYFGGAGGGGVGLTGSTWPSTSTPASSYPTKTNFSGLADWNSTNENADRRGRGGSGGTDGSYQYPSTTFNVFNGSRSGYDGGGYGGGGGCRFAGGEDESTVPSGNGAGGAVRLIWGPNRSFPSLNTTNL